MTQPNPIARAPVVVDGLVALVQGVTDFFKAHGNPASVALGWKARFRWDNQGPGGAQRVVFVPGRMPADATEPPKSIPAGNIEQPRIVKDNPRALRQWARVVSLFVWAVDPNNLQDEGAQMAATVALLEQTLQALNGAQYTTPDGVAHSVGMADVIYEDAMWVVPPSERAFGRELVVAFTLATPLFDVTAQTFTAGPALTREIVPALT